MNWHLMSYPKVWNLQLKDDVVIVEDGIVKHHWDDDDGETTEYYQEEGYVLTPVFVISKTEYEKYRNLILAILAARCAVQARQVEICEYLDKGSLPEAKRELEESEAALIWFRDIKPKEEEE